MLVCQRQSPNNDLLLLIMILLALLTNDLTNGGVGTNKVQIIINKIIFVYIEPNF